MVRGPVRCPHLITAYHLILQVLAEILESMHASLCMVIVSTCVVLEKENSTLMYKLRNVMLFAVYVHMNSNVCLYPLVVYFTFDNVCMDISMINGVCL